MMESTKFIIQDFSFLQVKMIHGIVSFISHDKVTMRHYSRMLASDRVGDMCKIHLPLIIFAFHLCGYYRCWQDDDDHR